MQNIKKTKQEMEIYILSKSTFVRLLYKIMWFFMGLPSALGGFFVGLGKGIRDFFLGIIEGIKQFGLRFVKGDIRVKISYIIMGFGNFTRKQIARGILYFLIQVGFILFISLFSWKYLLKFDNLGDIAMGEVIGPDGFPTHQVIDSSFQILLYSTLTFLVAFVFLAIYVNNTKDAYTAFLNEKNGVKGKPFIQDLADLLDVNYHKTMMSLPMVGIFAFTVLPLILTIIVAFTNFDVDHQPPGNLFTWVGIENFTKLFSLNNSVGTTFYSILVWTIIWAIIATFSNYILGMMLAMLINKKSIKGKKIFRTFFVVTIAVPQFVLLMLVSKMFSADGIVNCLLIRYGWIEEAIPFLTAKDSIMPKVTIILVNIWVGIPYTMLITTGILMNIPADLYESAKIDGANIIRMFVNITLPYMLFITGPYLLTQFIGNLNNFNVIFFLTGGGPNDINMYQAGQTDLLVTWLFKLTVDKSNYAIASTIGIAVFLISATFSLVVYNQSGSVKHEEEYQ